jgi:1-acyl-sn-glycerol-3-phosphate acyltransferase
MSDDRSGGAARPPLKLYRGGAPRRPGPPRSPRDVVHRLAALEKQVEAALGGRAAGAFGPGNLLRQADDLLDAVARVGRTSPRDLAAGAFARVTSPETVAAVAGGLAGATLDALYRWWFRVEVTGLDRVPEEGPFVVVANRAGTFLPYEGLMIALAFAGRAQPLVDPALLRVPVLGPALAGLGAGRDTGTGARTVLARGSGIVVFPEGPRARAKTFRQRYRLAGFGRGGFARLAIEHGAPILPVAVVGAEEAQPVLVRLPGVALGLPDLPVTPTFPWLGLAGLAPLPTKWSLHVGEPLDVAGAHPAATADDAARVRRVRDQVRERLQALLLDALRRRTGLFL